MDSGKLLTRVALGEARGRGQVAVRGRRSRLRAKGHGYSLLRYTKTRRRCCAGLPRRTCGGRATNLRWSKTAWIQR